MIGRRSGTGKPPRQKLKDLRGFEQITALMSPKGLSVTGYEPKRDTRTRRTLTCLAPRYGWYLTIWAVEAGRLDLIDQIRGTDPWPTVRIAGSVLADWISPWILVTLAYWENDHPYTVVHYEPRIPGRAPLEIIPRAYDGTWLEVEGPKWRPGEPMPREWFEGR
jgi:hypothetical protein